MTFYTVVILVLILAFSLSTFSKIEFAALIPSSIFLSIIWVTIFGIFNQLYFGLLALPIAISLIFAIALLRIWKNQATSPLNGYPNPAVLVFVFFAYLTFKFTRGMQFYIWDEFTHWGLSAKATYLFDALGPLSPAYVNNPQYPPGLSVFSYMISKIQGSWDESNVFWAYHLIIISVFTSVIANFKWKQLAQVLFAMALMVYSSVIFFDTYMNVYADSILGIVFAYSFYLATRVSTLTNTWQFANYLISLVALLLIKDIAIVFAIITIGAIAINRLSQSIGNGQKFSSNLFKFFKTLAVSALVLYGTRFIWFSFAGKNLKNGTQGAIAYSGQKFSQFNSQSPEAINIRNSFLEKLSRNDFSYTDASPHSIYWWAGLLFIPLVVSALFYKSTKQRILVLTNTVILIIGFTLYLFTLYLTYLTVFVKVESASLASFDRYVGTYLTAVIIFLSFLAVTELREFKIVRFEKQFKKLFKPNLIPSLTLFLCIFLITNAPTQRINTYLQESTEYSTLVRIPFQDLKNRFAHSNFKTDDKIWVITQHKHGFEFYLLQYELLPASVPAFPFSIGTPYNSEDIWTETKMTKEKWDKALDNFDYVVIFNTSESFIKEYSSLFNEPESLANQGIYKVIHSSKGNKLNIYK
jgi:hypothetical protein